MADDGDVLINLDDDGGAVTPAPSDAGEKTSSMSNAASAAKTAARPDADLQALKRRADDLARLADTERARAEAAEAAFSSERDARTKADATAIKRERQTLVAHWQKVTADHDHVKTAIDMARERENAARTAYIAAREAGDNTREADAIRIMTEANSAIAQLDAGRIGLEKSVAEARLAIEDHTAAEAEYVREREAAQARKAETDRQEQATRPPQAKSADDWIEGLRSTVDDGVVEWLKEHREFVTDDKAHRKFLRCVDDFVDDHGRSALKGAELLDVLNQRFFPDASGHDDADESAESASVDQRASRRVAPAAPVSRNAPAASTQTRTGSMRLSAAEQMTALQLYPELDRASALKRYATNKHRAIADNRYKT